METNYNRVMFVSTSTEFDGATSRANEAFPRLQSARIAEIVRADCPGQLTWAGDSFVQFGLYRSVELVEGLASEWNSGRLVNAVVLARTLTETVAALFFALDHVDEHLAAENVRKAHTTIVSAFFGSREGTLTDAGLPTAKGVLSQIDRLDKKMFEKKIRGVYDTMCEYTHPNAAGLMMFGSYSEPPVVLKLGYSDKGKVEAAHLAAMGLEMIPIVARFVDVYAERFRSRLAELDERFGRDIKAWPGDPADTLEEFR